MAKGEAKKNNQLLDAERLRQQQANAALQGKIAGAMPGAEERANRAYDTAYGGFSDIASNGGWSSGDRNAFMGDVGGLEALAGPKGTYGEFSKTGGYSEGDKTDFRARGTRVIPSYYSAVRNEQERLNRASGGNVGYNSQVGALNRDAAEGANNAVIDTESSLQNSIRSNRLAGAAGSADVLGRAGGMRLGFGNSVAGNKLAALGGISNLRGQTPGEVNALRQQLIEVYGMTAEQADRLIQLRMSYNPNVSTWDRIMQGTQAAASLASAFSGHGAGKTDTYGSRTGAPSDVYRGSDGGWHIDPSAEGWH